MNKLIEFEAFAIFAILENLMKSKSTTNHHFLIAVPILILGVLGCNSNGVGIGESYVPRV